MTAELDVSRAPLGQIAAASLVDAVAAGDDRLERHYLEVKSDLDMTKKTDVAKIAKYILGSANRTPELAATAFEGYGVMIVGVAPGAARGVPPIEVLEISKIVSQYLGASGPHWDVVRVPVAGSSNEVLVVVVDPPKDGQKPFPCRKDGDGLVDGRVYIRADGETREAKGDELDRLLERAAAQVLPDVAFDVAIDGAAHPVDVDESRTLEARIQGVTRELIDALPQPEPEPSVEEAPDQSHELTGATGAGFKGYPGVVSGVAAAAFAEALSSQTSALAKMAAELSRVPSPSISSLINTEPEKRSEEDYRASIEAWEVRFREAWPAAIDAVTGRLLEGITIRVKNETKTFFHEVELKIHLDGVVRGVDYFDDDRIHRSDLNLPTPPRVWGPVSRSFDAGLLPHQGIYLPSNSFPSTYRSPLDWRNSGSVDLRLRVGELRPREEYVFDEQELVLVLPAGHEAPVVGTWEITARDHNEIYSGSITIPVGEPVDLTEVFSKLLKLD
ncbi:MAG: hypothetical protein DI566_13600 [Microbacterium sp.]|nr:MAG: hypothetical protein DI566_13600 [Microbacterium sp.]